VYLYQCMMQQSFVLTPDSRLCTGVSVAPE
jgi:hypothetical protein